MQQFLRCRVGDRNILIPTGTIQYIQRASKWQSVPHVIPPIVGAIRSRLGWLPVLDLALLGNNRHSAPRMSTRFVIAKSADNLLYSILCEEVLEVVKISTATTVTNSEMIEYRKELFQIWSPSLIQLSSFNCTSIGQLS